MGQCSTLPEARNSSARHDSNSQQRDGGSRQRLNQEGRTESLDFNKLTTVDENTKAVDQRKLHVTVPANGEHEFAKFPQVDANQPQARDPEGHGEMAEPMDVDQRDSSQPVSLPPPPENAVRARCYKLNLDSEMVGLIGGTKDPRVCLGPFTEPPPPLTYSSSEDSVISGNAATSVAIQTAQIFRGITISKDGTILSQNARATRSNRGNKAKRGEKSRQAAKIDKAKDLVEEAVMTGKDPESGETANMVSLVIVGAYDDMKHLVRDGSKKLREADGLPDDTLLAVNRQRAGPQRSSSQPSPSKQKGSQSGSQRNQQDRSRQSLPQSVPPKLKSNPRDRPKARRGDEKPRRTSGFVADSCNDMNMMDTNPHGNIGIGDGDWRDALGFSRGFHSIWNCGGAEESGTVSPTQVCSPKDGKAHEGGVSSKAQQQPVYEGRDSTLGHKREGDMSARAN